MALQIGTKLASENDVRCVSINTVLVVTALFHPACSDMSPEADLVRSGMVPSDPPRPQYVTPEDGASQNEGTSLCIHWYAYKNGCPIDNPIEKDVCVAPFIEKCQQGEIFTAFGMTLSWNSFGPIGNDKQLVAIVLAVAIMVSISPIAEQAPLAFEQTKISFRNLLAEINLGEITQHSIDRFLSDLDALARAMTPPPLENVVMQAAGFGWYLSFYYYGPRYVPEVIRALGIVFAISQEFLDRMNNCLKLDRAGALSCTRCAVRGNEEDHECAKCREALDRVGC